MAFDRSNQTHLTTLKNEIETDPDGLGYFTNSVTQGILNIINLKSPSYMIDKPKISSAAIRSAVTYDAYNALAIDEQEWIRWMTGSNGFNEENVVVTPDLKTKLTDPSDNFWSAATESEMNAAMLALITVEGSRADNLFGYGTNITDTDWYAARDGG